MVQIPKLSLLVARTNLESHCQNSLPRQNGAQRAGVRKNLWVTLRSISSLKSVWFLVVCCFGCGLSARQNDTQRADVQKNSRQTEISSNITLLLLGLSIDRSVSFLWAGRIGSIATLILSSNRFGGCGKWRAHPQTRWAGRSIGSALAVKCFRLAPISVTLDCHEGPPPLLKFSIEYVTIVSY